MKRSILILITLCLALPAAAQHVPGKPTQPVTAQAVESASEKPGKNETPATTVNRAIPRPTVSGKTDSLQKPAKVAPEKADSLQKSRQSASIAAAPVKAAPKQRFLPTRRRIDREINKLKFAYKGEVIMGLTASYGTLSSDDTDILLILDNINADGTVATVKPFIGYFYRDNRCLGARFGYNYMSGTLDKGAIFDLGENNDVSLNIPYLDFNSNNYSFGIFHRSYAGLDPKGRFGLFAEFELSVSKGSSRFAYESEGKVKQTYSDNTQLKLAFNPGAAVYIFPNVCATLSFGLGGIQYTSVTQKDELGNKIGTREASNMKFKLNILAINIGMTIHMWDKKKQ